VITARGTDVNLIGDFPCRGADPVGGAAAAGLVTVCEALARAPHRAWRDGSKFDPAQRRDLVRFHPRDRDDVRRRYGVDGAAPVLLPSVM